MKDDWYADKRDLVKWGVILHLAEAYEANTILQVAYYRPTSWPGIEIDGRSHALVPAVTEHFRKIGNVSSIRTSAKVLVFDSLFVDRGRYLHDTLNNIANLPSGISIIFLDPDTGLQPKRVATLKHVLESELKSIWASMRRSDLLVLYQHQTNRNNDLWMHEKKAQFEKALELENGSAKLAQGTAIARDVAFFFAQK